MENKEINIREFKRQFNRKYPYIRYVMADKDIQTFLEQDHIKDRSLIHQMDLFQDYLIGNGLCEVQD